MPDSSGRKFSYVQLRYQFLTLKPGEQREILDVHEAGAINIIEYHVRNSKLAMEINIWGDNGSPINIMDFHDDMDTLLGLGLGLSPGDVQPVAGISPDPAGVPNPVHPYLVRYKPTTEADFLGNSNQNYGMLYTPVYPMEYGTRVQINVKNGDNTNSAMIKDIVVNRKVYATDVARPH